MTYKTPQNIHRTHKGHTKDAHMISKTHIEHTKNKDKTHKEHTKDTQDTHKTHKGHTGHPQDTEMTHKRTQKIDRIFLDVGHQGQPCSLKCPQCSLSLS